MIISKKKVFTPVTIILETEDEVGIFQNILEICSEISSSEYLEDVKNDMLTMWNQLSVKVK